jgi:uncharacterized membrane protein YkoI
VRKRTIAVLAVAGAMVLGGAGVVAASSGSGGSSQATASGSSRLDDGKDLLPQAKITEQEAIAAAKSAASGALNEVDLEHHDGRLVFNVDVGSKDVKVDASTGEVVAATSDD